jgi:hypothetical protein
VDGQPAHQAADKPSGGSIALVVGVLVVAALAVQSLVAFRFFLYCDENLRPGTSREMVCQIADDGGYLTGILLPVAGVLLVGWIGIRRRRIDIVVWGFAAAIIVGIGVPLTTAVLAGYH